ncbi:hypothetical protein V5799_016331, partial [Amblyomma americanum]
KKTDQNAVPALHLGYQRKVVLGRRRLVRHEHIPPAKKMKRKPRDENAGASDGGPLDFSTDALAQKEPPETAQADSQHLQDSDTSAEPPGAAQADSQQFQDTNTSTEPPEGAQAYSQHFQDTDNSTEPLEETQADSQCFQDTFIVPTKAARADGQQVQNECTVTLTALSSVSAILSLTLGLKERQVNTMGRNWP